MHETWITAPFTHRGNIHDRGSLPYRLNIAQATTSAEKWDTTLSPGPWAVVIAALNAWLRYQTFAGILAG